jgi:hypothetical protein
MTEDEAGAYNLQTSEVESSVLRMLEATFEVL